MVAGDRCFAQETEPAQPGGRQLIVAPQPEVEQPPITEPAPVQTVPIVAPQPEIQVDAQGMPLVSNSFVNSDIRDVLSQIGQQTGATIVPDNSVNGTVTLELVDVPLQRALKLVLMQGGFVLGETEEGMYLVTSSDPQSPNFRKIAKTRTLGLSYIDCEQLKALLPDTDLPFVKFDTKGGRVVVTAAPDDLEAICNQIAELDTPPIQVMVEALVVDVDKGAMDKFRIVGQATHVGLSTVGGLLTYLGEAQDIIGTLTWLQGEDKACIKANPRVLAQDGMESTFKVSVEQYFQMLTGRAGYEYSTLESIEAAVGLAITPHVALQDRMVTIKLKPEVGDVSGRGENNLPIITKRTAESTVRVADGQVVVIGGLLQEIERQSESKIPILGDLPLIGGLFRSKNNEKSQREVLIFIAPHILDELGQFEGKLLLEMPMQTTMHGEIAGSCPDPAATIAEKPKKDPPEERNTLVKGPQLPKLSYQ